ncbi:MAG: hypothetical protein CMH46_04225 [Muricauda sp.]|nr:hypothetical protein [Allomuricauda sp.]|tara:strand:+ start:67629 stop:68957 length:1329 start_codon:yes stop_codon:yes gene_type:complete
MKQNILEAIENEFDVGSLQLSNGLRIWPLIRDKIYFHDLNKRVGYSSKTRTRNKVKLVKNFFYGINNIFVLKRFDFLFFENTNKRILINNKYFDIYFDAWGDKLGRSKGLFVEFASESHYDKDKVYSQNIVSDLPFKLASFIRSFYVFPRIVNVEVLERIQEQKDIKINLRKELKRKLGEYYLYRFLFRYIKPRAIFVLSSFSKISIVMAAKSKNIPVYEAQHGFIGESHPFYHVTKRFEESYPDGLFSFGNYEINNNKNFIFRRNQILPIGGLQLEYLKSRALPDELKKIRNKYRQIFCITLQALKEEEIIGATLNYAKKHMDALFILCPKDRSISYTDYLVNKNYLVSQYPIYDILKIADYNLTIFSTTAVEGVSMGAKTIFYNADNLSKRYFNVVKLGASVIEEGDSLSEKHLNFKESEMEPYYIEGYFENVEKCNLNI